MNHFFQGSYNTVNVIKMLMNSIFQKAQLKPIEKIKKNMNKA